jgi:Phage tail lysozyme
MTALDRYKTKAVWLIDQLAQHFQFQPFQGAAVAGNAYQESMLTATLEEDGIVTSPTRGIGWFQWTGPRHVAFMAWCSGAKLDWTSDAAEFGFLKHELLTSYVTLPAKMRATTTLVQATEVFEEYYEKAGVVAMNHRITGAQIALAAWTAANPK